MAIYRGSDSVDGGQTVATAEEILEAKLAAEASAAAALISEGVSTANAAATAADVLITNADVVLTNADVVLTHADVVLTGLDVTTTNADVVTTNNNVITTNNNVTAAGNAQTAAVAAQAAAELAYDNFDDRYLGEKASDPTLDNDGNPLLSGALYFKTGVGWYGYNGSAWVSLTAITASEVTNVPAGNISATDVQAAINELDTEKEPADATILKDADIGVNVQAYDATIVVDADIGVTVQAQSTLLDDVVATNNVGRKNAIINGNFDIWQRGTSFTIGVDGYTADRWRLKWLTATKTVDSEGSWINLYTPTGTYPSIRQRIERAWRLSGKEVTFSFTAKGATNTESGFFYWVIVGGANSGVVPLNIQDGLNTWTFTMPSMVESDVFEIQIGLRQEGVENCSCMITNVQLELGSQATDFEYRSYGEELALCQRYYREYVIEGFNNTFFGFAGTSGFRARVYTSTVMRVSPTSTYSTTLTGTLYQLTSYTSLGAATGITITINLTGQLSINTSAPTGSNQPAVLRLGGAATVYFDAEL